MGIYIYIYIWQLGHQRGAFSFHLIIKHISPGRLVNENIKVCHLHAAGCGFVGGIKVSFISPQQVVPAVQTSLGPLDWIFQRENLKQTSAYKKPRRPFVSRVLLRFTACLWVIMRPLSCDRHPMGSTTKNTSYSSSQVKRTILITCPSFNHVFIIIVHVIKWVSHSSLLLN